MPSPESISWETTWILLPNGLSEDGEQLLLSVFVAPALVADDVGGPPRLSDFPDWLDWPARLRDARFNVDLLAERPASATVLELAASSELWQQIFPPSTAVEAFAADDFAQRPVMSYSVPIVADSMRRSYADTTMLAIDGLPQMDMTQGLTAAAAAGQPFGDVMEALGHPDNAFLRTPDDGEFARGFQQLMAVAQETMAGREGLEMVEVMPSTQRPSDEVARLLAFHRGTTIVTRNGEPDPEQLERLRESFDFHKILSALGEHPALLRRLGLVFDLSLPVSALEGTENGGFRLLPYWTSFTVTPDGGADLGVDKTPFTSFDFDPGSRLPFRAAAGSYPPGFVNLREGRFQVEQLDVDAAVEKVAAMVLAQATVPLDPIPADAVSFEVGAPVGPPALRTAGLVLVDTEWVQRTHTEMTAPARVDDPFGSPEQPLHAEDLTRGYRLDIYDETAGGWSSLHARTVRYLRDGEEVLGPVQDEGMFALTVTGPPSEPGSEPDPTSPLYMDETFVRWSGWSLSAPRPGRSLSVHPGGTDPDRPETAPQRIANEPLTSTGLQIEVRVTPGSLPRLRYGRTYRLRIRTVDLAGNGVDLATADAIWTDVASSGSSDDAWDTESVTFRRHEPLAPPVVHWQPTGLPGEADHRLVIRSGLDSDVDMGPSPEQDQCLLAAPKGSVELAERHGMLDDAIGTTERDRHRRSYKLAVRESGTLPEGAVDDIPYLPDPLATGIAIVGLPGMDAAATFKVRWQADSWDRPKPIWFRLVGHSELFAPGPVWDAAERTVTVPLTQALQVTVRVASLLPDDPDLGLLESCRARLDEDSFRRLEATVLDSRHCMFTPWQDVELIHAVQRPLVAPDVDAGGAEVTRAPGATEYRFPGSTIPDPASTGSLDLVARWQEWIDDPEVEMRTDEQGRPPVWTREMVAEVGSLPVAPPVEGETVAPRVSFYGDGSDLAPLQFSDTKHRTVTFQARAVSRFSEFFPPELAGEPGRLSVEGSTVQLSVSSTARPPVPTVVDVVPTTAVVVDEADSSLRRREGGWLRIYVARPWYLTGEGERLGVVVPSLRPAGPDDPHYRVSSLLGGDLAHHSFPPGPLETWQIGNGSGANLVGAVLPEMLEEFPGVEVPSAIVHGFEPQFDEIGQRWFFDVRIENAGYFPLVRLVVVRYQQSSIAAADPLSPSHFQISPVVVLEPVPLLPDRELRVDSSDPARITLSLSGSTYDHILDLDGSPNDRPEALARVTARFQERRARRLTPGSDDDWVTTATHTFQRLDEPDETGFTRWELTLELDATQTADPGTRRLLIVEEDLLPTDPAAAGMPAPGVGYEPDYSRRVVYSDVVTIDHLVVGPADG